ncbi:MAG: signal peptidase I [Firmicutes bacterium HGW-Firmicutes-1]|jgi:signal peptidase I|nr:MAG: signal peptidase I [Firmicutes bacterium HGW-Firmicutes-1]
MKKMDRILKEWIYAFCSAVILVFILYYVMWPIHVSGNSMEKTLSSGEIILVSKLSVYLEPCKYGDIIIMYIKEGEKKQKIVKRVIGIEGEHVVIKDGLVSINGKVLQEQYTSSPTHANIDLFVPKDAYFVLGDHREISKDSREFGCVFKGDIRGRAIFISNGL